MIINQGYHNKGSKAVNCNLINKILEIRDYFMSLPNFDKKEYEDYYKKYFENIEKNSYSLGDCISYLLELDKKKELIEEDIYIYTTERKTNTNSLNEKFKYLGKGVLPNGVEVIGFQVFSEECAMSMFQILYFDGKKLRLFTPFEGNHVNMVTSSCLQNESHMRVSEIDKKHPLYSVTFPNGVSEDELYEYWNVVSRYVAQFGIDFNAEEDADTLYIDFDFEAMNSEIESVLM